MKTECAICKNEIYLSDDQFYSTENHLCDDCLMDNNHKRIESQNKRILAYLKKGKKITEDFTKPESIEQEARKADNKIMIISIIFLTLTSSGIFWAIDLFAFQGFVTMNVFIKSDCNYEVPKGYEILTDGKYFVVKCSARYLSDRFLTVGIDMIQPMYPEITKPTKLVSECKARGYLKRYLKVKNPVKEFKPIVK